MRYIFACISVAALFIVAGCDRRQNIAVVPDRQGHAAYADGGVPPIGNHPQAGVGEMYHTLMPGETLSQVAKKYNVDLGWLIKRNDIQNPNDVKPNMQLIVPVSATAPSMPQDAQPAQAPQAAPVAPAPAPKAAPKSTKRR
ncbi:MAG: LysM peptidoglycan-binding domain-containing protein [Planctomycetes bacterium]|nr:LysM peptidoglycan-binding domain-containing protein [Planctomycetota bacterium]